MISKGVARWGLLLGMAIAPALAGAEAAKQSTPNAAGSTTYTYPVPAAAKPECNGAPCEDQQPHIIVTLPAPAPTPWPVHDRIAWAAYLVLALVGYAGTMLAVSTLKKIERHTAATESAANAAAEAAHAALLQTQALVNGERPWLMIGVEPTLGVENSFNVTATNRGRSPATIGSTIDQVVFALEEAQLTTAPSWKTLEATTPATPILLLPGESVSIKTVRREEAREFSGSEEQFKRVEAWEERLYFCGKVVYHDLISPAGKEAHETNWCCWYIHGRQKSGLALAGPPEYHAHT